MAIDIREARRSTAANSSAAVPLDQSTPTTADATSKHQAFFTTQRQRKLTAKDLMFFTERLGLLLETGIPLHQSLESISRQSDEAAMKELTQALLNSVTGGSTFARALSDHPDFFPATYRNLIAAAEAGGFLPVALDRLRDMEERREELRSTLSSAMSYPIILAVFSTLVVIFVLVVVFPKFSEIFSSIEDQLPITTHWLMAASDLLRRAWLPIFLGIGGAVYLGRSWIKTSEGRAMVDRMLFAIPPIRVIVIQLNIVQMLRVMGLSLGNGVSTVDALKSARESVSSESFRQIIDNAEQGVQEGRGLASGFSQSELVPDLVKQMLSTGEETGNLPVVMARLADFYEREWRKALGVVAKLAEPIMLLVMGCVVGLIVSSLILPIFKLSRAVH